MYIGPGELEHYRHSYTSDSCRIGNLDNIICEIRAWKDDISVLTSPITTLEDIIRCDGKRKLYALPDSDLIRLEKEVIQYIEFILATENLPLGTEVVITGIDTMAMRIYAIYHDEIFPFLKQYYSLAST